MRSFLPSLLILFLAPVASGQVQNEKLKDHPTLKIVGFQWLASGGNSFADWGSGSGNGGIFPNVSNWGVARSGDVFGSTIARVRTPFYCRATVTLKNSGSKTIRAVHLDYIFSDQATGEEFLRYQLFRTKEIEPGDVKTLEQHIYQKGGKYRKGLIPAKPPLDMVLRTREAATALVIRRVEYADGTVQEY